MSKQMLISGKQIKGEREVVVGCNRGDSCASCNIPCASNPNKLTADDFLPEQKESNPFFTADFFFSEPNQPDIQESFSAWLGACPKNRRFDRDAAFCMSCEYFGKCKADSSI
jgi:hypothetical protein